MSLLAARDINAWIPVPLDATVLGGVPATSAIRAVAMSRNMTSDTLEVPSLWDADVDEGETLVEDSNDAGKRTMYSRLFNGKQTLSEDKVEDSVANPMLAYAQRWLTKLWVSFDNASIGVTGARSATIGDYRPYTSIYRAVRENDSQTGYSADTNYLSDALTYDTTSTVMGMVEMGDMFDEGSGVWLAHPALKDALRKIKDLNDEPIFKDPSGAVVTSTLHGRPINWTRGSRTSANFKTLQSNPLLVYVNRQYLTMGNRIAPQTRFIDASTNTTVLAHTLQHRARLGFTLGAPGAAGVLEVTSGGLGVEGRYWS